MIRYGIIEKNIETLPPALHENESVFPVSQTSEKAEILNQETVEALSELGEILREINKKMHEEGYTIQDGKIIKRDL